MYLGTSASLRNRVVARYLVRGQGAIRRRFHATDHLIPQEAGTSAAVAEEKQNEPDKDSTSTEIVTPQSVKKTVAQLDEELRLKMANRAGDGGEAGVEYEDGQPVAMKRGVRENMFRVI